MEGIDIMASSRTFRGIAPAAWLRVRESSASEYGTVYSDEHRGTATTVTPVGRIRVDYTYDAQQGVAEYTLIEKPLVLSETLIWDRIAATIARYSGG
jgi:hypothetical protein